MTAWGRRLPLTACATLVLIGLTFGLNRYPLLDPDEGRNAEVAREMAERNDYLLPRLNGLPYVDKPVVFFAAEAAVMELLGPTPFAARVVPLLFTLATVPLVWWFGRRLFGPEAGWIAAIAFSACPLVLAFARTVIMDSATALFVTAALVGFYQAVEERQSAEAPGGRAAHSWSALAWASLGLGALTKGPIALAIPLMVALPYAAWRRAWRAVLDPVGMLLFAALVLPWVRAVSQRVPGFLHYVFVTETYQRALTPALERTGPWWYFVPVLLAGALPWSAALLASTRRLGESADRRTGFLLLWILVPLVFFSLSQSKRPQYALPLIPPVALLTAGLWGRRASAAAGVALVVTGATLGLGQPLIPRFVPGVTPAVSAAIPGAALALSALCLLAGAAAVHWRDRWDAALIALVLPVTAIPVAGGPLLRAIGAERSAAELARALTPALGAQTEIVAVRVYPPSLAFYLRRTLVLATDSGRELTSNYLVRHPDGWRTASGSVVRPGDWWRDAALACDRPRIFVIGESDADARSFLAPRLPRLAETPRYAAFGPCGRTDLAAAPN